MGLGKTIQAIAALRILRSRGEAGETLVVMPAGLVLQWRRQFRIWAPELKLSTVVGNSDPVGGAWSTKADVYLVGYEALRSDAWSKSPHSPAARKWNMVVIDEAQRIKNAEVDLARAVKRLERSRSWALTGTPLENRLDDLISILEFAAPGRFDPAGKAVGLRKLLAEVQLRRRRRDVLPIFPRNGSTVHLTLGRRQEASYNAGKARGARSIGSAWPGMRSARTDLKGFIADSVRKAESVVFTGATGAARGDFSRRCSRGLRQSRWRLRKFPWAKSAPR